MTDRDPSSVPVRPALEVERASAKRIAAPDADNSLVTDINLTDVGNGTRIAARHGDDLHYCYSWARWLTWDDRRWNNDDPGEPVRRAKESARWLAASALDLRDSDRRRLTLRWALESEKDARVRAALWMAQSVPGISITPTELDTDPWLFNVENGTIDLRTGQLCDHDRADLITKLAPVAYDPGAKAPRWEQFLEEILVDDRVISFMQKLCGYMLTGLTREQILAIFWGSGENGKSTLINMLMKVLGDDYAQQAPSSTFLERRGDGVPNDIARLRGQRLVVATETAETRHLNEALIKQMTGGDRMSARYMRSEWFDFTPEFKPVLVTNHKPEIRGTDHAIWRRIRLIPFTVRISDEQRDRDLDKKLQQELPGILTWAVAGCQAWLAEGLEPPEAIIAAGTEYREEQDAIGRFVADCCTLPGMRRSRQATCTPATATGRSRTARKRSARNPSRPG